MTEELSTEWVSIKEICRANNLCPDRQRERLKKRGEGFEQKIITKAGRDGKKYKMLCIKQSDLGRYLVFAKENLRVPQKKERL